MRRCLRTTAACVLSAAVGPVMASPDWDLIGIKLGMTEAQVRAAFQAYDPKGKILAHNATATYSDKVTSFRTPPFLQMMELRVVRQASQTPLRVWFSGPVGPVQVIGVARQEYNLPNPSNAGPFHQSLQTKYGAPTARYGDAPVWESQGKPSCARASHGIDLGDLPQVVSGQKNISNAIPLLEGRQQGPGSMQLPKDLSTCGTILFYFANMDPVKAFTAGLFDVGALAATHYSRNQWVQQLQTEAIRKREGQAQAPRL